MVIRTVRAFSRPKIRRRFWKSLQVRVLRKILTMLGRNQGSSWNDFHGTAQSSFLVIMHLASTMCHVCGLASVHSNCHFIRDKPRPCKNPILWGFGLCLQEHSAVVQKFIYNLSFFYERRENVMGKYSRAGLSELQRCGLAILPVTQVIIVQKVWLSLFVCSQLEAFCLSTEATFS